MAKEKPKAKASKEAAAFEREREAVLSDFRKIAGPLRGRNRGRKPKA